MKYLRVVLKGEPRMWFDYPIPNGTTFANLIMMIRAGGFFATPAVYVPIEQIHHMMEIELTSGEQPAAPRFMQ
jgi:hypothetical protein